VEDEMGRTSSMHNKILVPKPEGMRPLGMRCGNVDWIRLAHNGDQWWVVYIVMAGNFMTR